MNGFARNPKLVQARRLMGILQGRAPVGPATVSLEVTHHCNLRCSFCESHGIHQPAPVTARRSYAGERRFMDLETIRRLARDLADLGTDLVELSGKGDPITHPQLPEIVRAIKECGLRCALVVNGTLASKDLVPTLVDCGVDRVNVSLNAGSREVYAKVCGRDLWDRAYGFISDLVRSKKEARSSRPWVRASHVLCTDNASDMDNIVRVCGDLGVDEVICHVMGELPETRFLRLTPADVTALQQGIPQWRARLQELGIKNNLDELAHELGSRVAGSAVQENPLQRRIPCYEAWMFCVIGPDGAVVPCCYCEEEVLGNVFDESFKDIWKGALYRDLRRRMLEMPKTGRWICGECFTNCNRAVLNQRVHNRIHLLKKVRSPRQEGAPSGS